VLGVLGVLGGPLSLSCTEMIDCARDCVFAFLGCWARGEARRLRAGALAFLMGEVVVPFLLWAREDGFALPDWERVVVAIVAVGVSVELEEWLVK